MAVKIKLKRLGKVHHPQYRIVIADARTARNGRAIEEIGKYHPKEEPSLIVVDSERVQYWLGVGAQPTDPVLALLKVTGDWQKFKGLPGAEGTLRVAEPKADRASRFEAAAKEAADAPIAEAITAKKKAGKSEEPAAEAAADEVAVEAETTVEAVEATEVEAPAEAVAETTEVEAAVEAESTESTESTEA